MTNIPPLPEDLSYDPNGDFAIFLGLYLSPTYGRWISINEFTDVDLLGEYGKVLCAAYTTQTGNACDEYGIFDSEGYEGLLGEGPLELAITLASVADKLGNHWDAFPAWVEHRGRAYSLYSEGQPVLGYSLMEKFGDDFIGIYESEKAYAEERFSEALEQHEAMTEELDSDLRMKIFSYMDWERLAHDYECGDVYYADVPSGTAVFWRS